MGSSVPRRLSSVSSLTGTILSLGLLLTLGMVGCSDTVAPSSTSTHDLASGPNGESVWAPLADARAAGSAWLQDLNKGDAAQSYGDLLHSGTSPSRAEWTEWVQKRRSTLGAAQSRRLVSVRLSGRFGPSNPPTVRLGYSVDYESGAACRLSLVMMLADSDWTVADYAFFSCDDVAPTAPMVDISSSSVPSSPHKLPQLVEGWERLPGVLRGWKAVQKQVPTPEVAKKAQGRVLVEFTVETNGQVTNVHVKENGGGPFDLSTSAQAEQNPEDLLYPEARQAIRATPFRPGQVEGTPTRTRLQLPVTFNCVTMRAAGLEKPCLPGE
jgi:hypothetical protein